MIDYLASHCSLLVYFGSITLENDSISFVAGIGLLIGYLIFSAATEMGTKLPWKK